MPRGRKPKQSSAGNEFAIAFEHFKKGFERLISAAESKKEPARVAQPARKVSGGGEKPAKGEPAYALYEQLEKSKRPVAVEDLAKKLDKSVASIRLYLSKYNCFENVRGKGYRLK